MAKLSYSVVNDTDSILSEAISNHPNFKLDIVSREVVITEIRASTKEFSQRGFFLDYYINHYINETIDKSFLKQTKIWSITDSLLITQRDENFLPVINPERESAIALNKLSPTIKNPDYLSDKELAKVPTTLPNPEYINDEETPYVPKTIPNSDYEKALFKNKLSPTIKNPDYLSDEELARVSEFVMVPAFTYLLSVIKTKPETLFMLLSFYIKEQDLDGFFNDYK